jgi:hypothetical protein
LPVARAGATERIVRIRGKSNGETTPTTPNGARRAMLRRPGVLGSTCPCGCITSDAAR